MQRLYRPFHPQLAKSRRRPPRLRASPLPREPLAGVLRTTGASSRSTGSLGTPPSACPATEITLFSLVTDLPNRSEPEGRYTNG